MANLSAYIDFNLSLNKSTSTSWMLLSDPDAYPPGVDVGLKGYFIITQPDGITITGNYLTPDIEWDGSALTDAFKELRLRADGNFQQGLYTITYKIVAPGYDETSLTKTVTLSFTMPTLAITENLDVFTPTLSVTDATDYVQTGMTWLTTSRAWAATIISVEGTNRNIAAITQTFDLSYLGSYYDSQYNVTLTAAVSYLLDSPDDWVGIYVELPFSETYYAFIPPTLVELLELLTDYKATVDAAHCICGPGCCGSCTQLKNTYTLAVSIYTHIVGRGRVGATTGLGAYVIQLQKLLSNCVTPAYTNTNEVIPPYDWGQVITPGTLVFFKQMVVGSGVNDAPPDGATTYTDALLISKSVMVYLDSLLMGNGLPDRLSITYDSSTGTITWNSPLYAPQLISIYTF